MAKGDYHRWLYRGHHAGGVAKLYNKVYAFIASSGIAPNYLVTLEVTGRKSGKTFSLPLVMLVYDGERYLVSMLGKNAPWVLNVQAAGGKAVLRSGKRREVQLEEVPPEKRPPLLKAYLKRAPGARPHIPVNKEAPLAEFEKIAADFPVFRVTSQTSAELQR